MISGTKINSKEREKNYMLGDDFPSLSPETSIESKRDLLRQLDQLKERQQSWNPADECKKVPCTGIRKTQLTCDDCMLCRAPEQIARTRTGAKGAACQNSRIGSKHGDCKLRRPPEAIGWRHETTNTPRKYSLGLSDARCALA